MTIKKEVSKKILIIKNFIYFLKKYIIIRFLFFIFWLLLFYLFIYCINNFANKYISIAISLYIYDE